MMRTFFLFLFILISTYSYNQDTIKSVSNLSNDTLTDIEGNKYKTVIIGNKRWMAENLRVSHFMNGDEIPTCSDDKDITKETSPKYSWVFPSVDVAKYGRLYTWYVTQDSRGVCPIGWRVPNDADWIELSTFLGGDNVSGGLLKDTSLLYWNKPNHGATNSSGFTAYPAGYRQANGEYLVKGYRGYWWSYKEMYYYTAWNTALLYVNSVVNNMDHLKKNGLSIRCIKN
jgi:uncharacterized protein (TIGR02145 family)